MDKINKFSQKKVKVRDIDGKIFEVEQKNILWLPKETNGKESTKIIDIKNYKKKKKTR